MAGLEHLFSFVCGQEHVWALRGEPLPFCQRCTGLYVGGVFALLFYAFFRPRPASLVLWIHGLLLLLMVPFGFHWIEQSAEVRMLTGQFFAIGLVYYLTLNPALRLSLWNERSREHLWAYGLVALAGIAVLQAAVHAGGARTGTLLAWMGVAGLVAYAALVIANLVVLPPLLWSALRRRATSSTP